MIVQSVHYTFAPEDADRVEAMFRELRNASRSEAGVIAFVVARSQDKPVFVLWEEYRDQAALEAHAETENFKRFVLNGIRPLAQHRDGATAVPIS